jgi:AraC-like DNA-binding protein
VLVTESTGKRFIGDSITDFSPGDLAFIGPNIPHLYRNHEAYYMGRKGVFAKSIVIHFLESSFGDNFLALPETKKLQKLFMRSTRGLAITGKTNNIVGRKMHELCEMSGLSRWIGLLEILDRLSQSKDTGYISNAIVKGKNEMESDRFNTVVEFVLKNFSREIMISEVAALVSLAENSFSRYFTLRTRKTFTAFVNEVRLSHACSLLAQSATTVTEICYECGFNNLSNFNRQFRLLYNTSPLQYRKALQG